MLVTNLSQSPGLRVLGTSRLYQLLDETGHRDDRTMSAPIVESVARKAQATTALVGSFVRAGSQIRIQATLQDPKSGEVIASERVEGDAEDGLFALVDELTGRLRKRLETLLDGEGRRQAHASWKEKKLQDVTTTSVEAWKDYAEGSRYHERGQEKEAQGYFEKAVEADPGFAMALAKLSIVHGNLGNVDKARAYSAKAVEKAENLPPGERYYIEGRHYSLDPATIENAVAAYQKAVDDAPDHTAARNNLAQLLFDLQALPGGARPPRGAAPAGHDVPRHLHEPRPGLRGDRPVPTRRARPSPSYAAEHPDRAASFENLAYFELTQGRTEAALAGFDKAASLHPDDSTKIETGRFAAYALRDEWPQAEAAAKRLMASDDPRQRWEGGATLAMASLYRGDVGEARRLAAEGAKTGGNPEERVGARLFGARARGGPRPRPGGARRGRGRPAREGQGAEARGPGSRHEGHLPHPPRPEGRGGEEPGPGRRVPRDDPPGPRRAEAPAPRGRDGTRARRPRRGPRGPRRRPPGSRRSSPCRWRPAPVEIRYALARTALEGGDTDGARKALRAVVDAGPARVMTPVPYVRSLALLAALEEKAGRTADARRLYERYLSYWKSGQIDRAEVARAGQRLASLRPRPAA